MKNKLIKIISLALAAIMCVGILCSCSTNSKTYAESENNKVSLAMYSLITSLMKGNDAYYIYHEYGDYNSSAYWDKIVDLDGQMTMKEYYQYMVDEKIKYNLAALDLFDELKLKLSDAEIQAIDAEMDEFVQNDGNGSKNSLNAILSNYGANYKTLREYKIMNAKINKLFVHLYGTDASKISDEIKQEYMNENYVAFKMILLPTYEYAYKTDKYKNDVYYETTSEGKIKTEKGEDGKTYSVIAYDLKNGIELDTDGDGKNDFDELGNNIYYIPSNHSIAYDTKNGVTFDSDGDGKNDVDKYGGTVYYIDTNSKKIAYDTVNGGKLDVDGDGELDTDQNGDKIFYNYDISIAYDTEKGVRVGLTDKDGNPEIKNFSDEKKEKIKNDAKEVFELAEIGNYSGFEKLIKEHDKNYSVESEDQRGGMIYLSKEESYTSGSELMNGIYDEVVKLNVGEKYLHESEFGYHIIMRYDVEVGAFADGKYEFYFESFSNNLSNKLFFDKLEPYAKGVTVNEKYKEKVDIKTIAPNYNFY